MPASNRDSEGSAGPGPAEPLHSGEQAASEPVSAEPAGGEPADPAANRYEAEPAEPGGFTRGRYAFRRWRRSRPFWGALIALLGGAEITLSEKVSLSIVIHLGAQGIAGLVIPIVLMLCAVLLWFNPSQRLFYSILAVLSALGSFITSNLGGFLLGGLLGIVGGSLAFAWAPDNGRHREQDRPGYLGPDGDEGLEQGEGPEHGEGRDGDDRARGGGPEEGRPEGLALLLGDPEPEPEIDRPPDSGGTLHAVQLPFGLALLAPILHPLLSACLVGLGLLVPAAALNLGTATSSGPGITVSLTSSSPSPTASTSPSPSPSQSPTPSPSPSPTASASPTASPSPSPQPSGVRKHAAASSLTASQTQSVLTAGSAHLEGLSYDGVASVPTADGGSVAMLKFSMSSMTLSDGTKLMVSEGGLTFVTSSPSLAFSGNVVLYTTKISGELLGIPFTYTPDNPPPLLLSNMDFTNVVTDQPFAQVGELVANGVQVSIS
jgi:Family of unknown function (DUF6114)